MSRALLALIWFTRAERVWRASQLARKDNFLASWNKTEAAVDNYLGVCGRIQTTCPPRQMTDRSRRARNAAGENPTRMLQSLILTAATSTRYRVDNVARLGVSDESVLFQPGRPGRSDY
jgi:hypothetical protein